MYINKIVVSRCIDNCFRIKSRFQSLICSSPDASYFYISTCLVRILVAEQYLDYIHCLALCFISWNQFTFLLFYFNMTHFSS